MFFQVAGWLKTLIFDAAQVQIPYALEAPLTNCRTICFLSDVRIIRHHRHQMMFPWVKNPFFCGAQAPKVDCCLACLRSTRYETSVGMTQPVTDLEMWKFPSQRMQEKQEDDLVQLMAGASS